MFSEVVPPMSTSASVFAKAAGAIVERRSRTAETASPPEGSPRTGTESRATRPSAERSISPRPKRGSAASLVRSCVNARWAAGCVAPLAKTIWTGLEVALGGREALLGCEPVGHCGDAARADVQADDRRGGDEQRRNRQRQAQPGSAQHGAHDRAPQAALWIGGLQRAPADHRNPQSVDAVAEQPEQGRQQRGRGE